MNYLKLIDTNTNGSRNDLTPIFKDNSAFKSLTEDVCRKIRDVEFDYVVGIDALGFILATAMAWKLEKGMITIRKGFKLPVSVERAEFIDYTGTKKFLEISKNILNPGKKVVLVDEWIETGAQIRAAARLIESQSCTVAAITAIGFEKNVNTEDLFLKYDCRGLTDGRIIDLLANDK